MDEAPFLGGLGKGARFKEVFRQVENVGAIGDEAVGSGNHHMGGFPV